MAKVLSQSEIDRRMIEWRNLKRLHAGQKVRIESLEHELRLVKQENALLRTENQELHTRLEAVSLQMEELRTIVFGRKRKECSDDASHVSSKKRTSASYHRSIPSEDEVTDRKHHPLEVCPVCRGTLTDRHTHDYFEEDIEFNPPRKVVRKHTVETGWCKRCKKQRSAIPLPSASVILGAQTQRFTTYLSVVLRLSYTNIQSILQEGYGFPLSQGEITKILCREGERLRAERERLKDRIRGEPAVHQDETSWKVFRGNGTGTHAWVMVGGASGDMVYELGTSRGKGVSQGLLSDSDAVVVTDDYGAYRTLKKHQLCWTHINRKLRDLAQSGVLKGAAHQTAATAHRTFQGIYASISRALQWKQPKRAYPSLLSKLKTFTRVHSGDPSKLRQIKRQVAARTQNYLTCLRYPGVAPDNNAAERALRHLVIKRKVSFGSYSAKTAETLAILTSVLLSYRNQGTLGNYLRGV
jgi:hypothetical protein